MGYGINIRQEGGTKVEGGFKGHTIVEQRQRFGIGRQQGYRVAPEWTDWRYEVFIWFSGFGG